MADQYNSQPPANHSSWILNKWRRSSKHDGSSSSGTANPQEFPVEQNFTANRRSVHRENTRKWAIMDDESYNWSENVVDFYNNGDSQFCYSVVFFSNLKLDKQFWGALLGRGYLTAAVRILHI
jgi:hypothetical protein